MSNFLITKDRDGTIIEVTAKQVVELLAKPGTGPVFRDLTADNELTIELEDGPAVVRRSKGRPSQQFLQLPQPLHQDYLADVQIQFLLPAKIRCRAESSAHVRALIPDVVHGDCGVPKHFHFWIRPEEISALFGKMEAGDVTAIADVQVTGVQPYHLLTDGRRT